MVHPGMRRAPSNSLAGRKSDDRVRPSPSLVRDPSPDRKCLEEALRLSESRYRSLVQASSLIVWTTPGAEQQAKESPEWRAFTGQTKEQMAGWGWLNAIHPEDREYTAQAWKRAVETGSLFQVEQRLRRHDGVYRHMLARAAPVLDDEGNVREWVGMHADITDRKLVEETLRRSEAHVRRVIDTLSAFVGVMTPDGVLIEANHTALEVAGLKLEDVVNRPFEETYWWSYSPAVQAQLRQAIERAGQGESVRYDVDVRVADGQFISIDFQLVPMRDDDGQIINLIPSALVITERKRAELKREEELRKSKELFQTLLDHMPLNAYMKDADGRYLFHNKASRPTFADTIDSAGKIDSEIFHPEVAREYRRNDLKVLRSGRLMEFIERSVEEDGEHQWLSVKFPFTNAEGRLLIAGMSLDITARQRAEQEHKRVEKLKSKQKLNRQLLEREILAREEERRQVARELHDESGQLLASLLAGLRLIEDAKSMKTAKSSARILRQLTATAIDELGRLSRGLHPSVLDDLGLAQALGHQIAEYSKLHGVKIDLKLEMGAGRLPPLIETGLFRIVQEALTNIAKHARAKSGMLSIRCVRDQLLLRITDDGYGFRANQSPMRRLGLQGMRERAAIMGGTFRVSSKPGSGTVISVKVPLNGKTGGVVNTQLQRTSKAS